MFTFLLFWARWSTSLNHGGAQSDLTREHDVTYQSDLPGEWEVDPLAFDCGGDNALVFVPSVYIEDVLFTNWDDNFVFETYGCEDDPGGILETRNYTCAMLSLNVDTCFSTLGFLDIPLGSDQDLEDTHVYMLCPSTCNLCVHGALNGKFNATSGEFQAKEAYLYAPNCEIGRSVEGIFYGYNSSQIGLGPNDIAWEAIYEIDFSSCTYMEQICYTRDLEFSLNSSLKLAEATRDVPLRPARIDDFVGNWTIEPKVEIANCPVFQGFDRVMIVDDMKWPYFHWTPLTVPEIPIPMKYVNGDDKFFIRNVSPFLNGDCSSAALTFDGEVNYTGTVSWNATVSLTFTPDCGCIDTTFKIRTVSGGGDASVSDEVSTVSTEEPRSVTTETNAWRTTRTTTTALMTSKSGSSLPDSLANMKIWQLVLTGLGAFVLLCVVCLGIYYFICMKNRRRDVGASHSPVLKSYSSLPPLTYQPDVSIRPHPYRAPSLDHVAPSPAPSPAHAVHLVYHAVHADSVTL